MTQRQVGAAHAARSVLPARVRRAAVTLGLGAALALPLVVAAPAPAQAVGLPGYCPDATGVTVVVDFQALGGGVVVRCAPAPLAGSGTGLDALVGAGISLEGTRRWGDSFICRLGGKPAVTTTLAVTGQPGYHEQCLDTPPSAAFWGYWYAADNGAWQYSQQGVKGHRAMAGGFEGWSFSLNASGSGNPAPRLAPTRPAKPARPATPATGVPAPKPAAGSGSAATGSGSSASAPTSAGGGSTPRLAVASTPGAAPTPVRPGGATPSSESADPSTAAGATAQTAAPPVVSGELAAAPVSSSGAPGSAGSAGPSTGTVVGVGILAFLLVAGAGTAWRRRRGADSS
ncbi:hypothetical protein V3N99_02725 [Dermatophilaceae bacterium Soc4.6]